MLFVCEECCRDNVEPASCKECKLCYACCAHKVPETFIKLTDTTNISVVITEQIINSVIPKNHVKLYARRSPIILALRPYTEEGIGMEQTARELIFVVSSRPHWDYLHDIIGVKKKIITQRVPLPKDAVELSAAYKSGKPVSLTLDVPVPVALTIPVPVWATKKFWQKVSLNKK